MKNERLDVAICPSCAAVITRQELPTRHEMAKGLREAFVCSHCGYEYNVWPYRPLTLDEMMQGRESTALYADVDLERYTRKVIEIVTGECNDND